MNIAQLSSGLLLLVILTNSVLMQLLSNLVTYAYAVLLIMDFKEGLNEIGKICVM
jgi:hypothetical protein